MMKKTAQILTLMSLLTFAACVTVNIYFPAAQVERAAEDIVEEVYGNDAQPAESNKDQSALQYFLAMVSPSVAHAQSVTKSDIDGLNKSNSAIRGLKQTIAANHQQLIPFYNAGNIGISNEGFLRIINKNGLKIKDTAKLRRLVSSDNKTREQLYEEVAASMNIAGSEIEKIKNIFADVWQKRAPSGWFIQDSNGNWNQK